MISRSFFVLTWSFFKRRSSDFNGEYLSRHVQVTHRLLWGYPSSYIFEDTPTMKSQSRKSQREEKKSIKAKAAATEKAAKVAAKEKHCCRDDKLKKNKMLIRKLYLSMQLKWARQLAKLYFEVNGEYVKIDDSTKSNLSDWIQSMMEAGYGKKIEVTSRVKNN